MESSSPGPDFAPVRVSPAARRLGWSTSTVKRRAANGQIRHWRTTDGELLLDADDVERLARERERIEQGLEPVVDVSAVLEYSSRFGPPQNLDVQRATQAVVRGDDRNRIETAGFDAIEAVVARMLLGHFDSTIDQMAVADNGSRALQRRLFVELPRELMAECHANPLLLVSVFLGALTGRQVPVKRQRQRHG